MDTTTVKTSSPQLPRWLASPCWVATAALLCSQALAQPHLFKCADADGTVEFTDKACDSAAAGEPLVKPGDGFAARKTQNDARLQRDKALTRQLELDRQAEEEALRAAQEMQHKIAADIAARLSRERGTRNAATISILPSGGCDQCKTPGNDTWPGYIR